MIFTGVKLKAQPLLAVQLKIGSISSFRSNLLLFVFLNFCLVSYSQENEEIREKIDKTDEIIAERREQDAQNRMRARETYEQSSEFRALQRSSYVFGSGFDKLKLGDYKGSIKDFSEYLNGLDESPVNSANKAHAYLNRGVAYYYLNDYRMASYDFKNSRSIFTSAQEKFKKMGIDAPYFTKNIENIDGWIKAADEIIHLEEKKANIIRVAADYNKKAFESGLANKYQEAIDYFNKSFQIIPNPIVLSNRGIIKYLIKNKPEGLKDINDACRLAKNENEIYLNIASAIYKLQVTDTTVLKLGISYLEKSEAYVNKYENHSLRAWHLLKLNRMTECFLYLESAKSKISGSTPIIDEVVDAKIKFLLRNGALAQFSNDGKKLLATYRRTGELILWDATSGKKLIRYKGNSGKIFSANLTDNGKYVLAFCTDSTTALWNTTTGKLIKTSKDKIGKTGKITSPDGKTILAVNINQMHGVNIYGGEGQTQIFFEDIIITVWEPEFKTLTLKK
jgi:tetratricopeptide (TPR) repeat protein